MSSAALPPGRALRSVDTKVAHGDLGVTHGGHTEDVSTTPYTADRRARMNASPMTEHRGCA